MQKSTFVKAKELPIETLPAKPKEKLVELEILLDDEVFIPGEECVLFILNGKIVQSSLRKDIEHPTNASWKYDGYIISESNAGPFYSIPSDDFENAIEELGISIFI